MIRVCARVSLALLLLVCSLACGVSTGASEGAAAFEALRTAFTQHGAYIHPAIELRTSPAARSNGLFAGSSLGAGLRLLEVPNSLALTADAAFESLATRLTDTQIDAIITLQTNTCGLVDWMMVIYVAVTAIQLEHEVLLRLSEPLPPWRRSTTRDTFALQACPSTFFTVEPDNSFPATLHAAWSRMVALYPPSCAGLVCLPQHLLLEILNTPLLLDTHHRHIACLIDTRRAAEDVAAVLASVDSRLPPIPLDLLIWSLSMVLSRQQSIAPDIGAIDGHTRVPALLPFFDLFNSHPNAENSSHPHVYQTKYVEADMLTPQQKPQPAVQAVTQADMEAGDELFDLYGGGHASSNVDLLSFFGFGVVGLPTDHVSLIVRICTDDDSAPSAEHAHLVAAALDRMEAAFVGAPLAVDELWTEEEHARFRVVGGSSSPATDGCLNSRLHQHALSNSGVAITLPILVRIVVATTKQLANPHTVQQLLSGGVLSRSQERTSLLLLLSWLADANAAATDEWSQLHCQDVYDLPAAFPQPPALTPTQTASLHVDARIMWRTADDEAAQFIRDTLESHSEPDGSTFFFDNEFYTSLCALKTSHRRLIMQAAHALSQFV